MYFSNWPRNRRPYKRILNEIPILLWNTNTRIDFSRVFEFGTKGFAYVYRINTTPNKKLLPIPIFGHFWYVE